MAEFLADISSLFALCGIVSIRNFIPAFVFALAKRLSVNWAECPDKLAELFARAPDWISSDVALVALGFLAFWELWANWNDTAREFLDEANFDKYTKPILAFLATYSLVSPDVADTVQSILDAGSAVLGGFSSAMSDAVPVMSDAVDASSLAASLHIARSGLAFLPAVCVSAITAFITSVLASIRRGTARFLRSVDPDNSLKLHSFAATVEETSWMTLAICAVGLPILALVVLALFLCAEWAARRLSAKIIEWLLRPPTDVGNPSVVARYRRRLIEFHRCPSCRKPLHSEEVCEHCGCDPWTFGFSRNDFVRCLDTRFGIALGLSLLLSGLPVVGYLFGYLALNLAVVRPIRPYTKRRDRLSSSCILRFLKFVAFLLALLFSTIPFASVLLLAPHAASYLFIRRRFLGKEV